MNIFLSFCSEDEDLGTFLRAKLCEEGHQTFIATNVEENVQIQNISRLHESEAFITIVSKGSNSSRWQQFEWQTALELSWNKPSLIIIGIVDGRINPPSFLLNHPIIRITKNKSQHAVVAEINRHLTQKDFSKFPNKAKFNEIIKKGMNKISSEMDKFRLTDSELEKERIWIQKKIDSLSRIDPENIEIANLQIKLSDVLMTLGYKEEVVDVLQKGLSILEKNGDVTESTQVKIQEKLALALEKIGNYEGAIDHICLAMNAIGLKFETQQVQNQLLQCQNNIPDFVSKLSESLNSVSYETATYGRRFLETLQQIDETMKASKSAEKKGGQS